MGLKLKKQVQFKCYALFKAQNLEILFQPLYVEEAQLVDKRRTRDFRFVITGCHGSALTLSSDLQSQKLNLSVTTSTEVTYHFIYTNKERNSFWILYFLVTNPHTDVIIDV